LPIEEGVEMKQSKAGLVIMCLMIIAVCCLLVVACQYVRISRALIDDRYVKTLAHLQGVSFGRIKIFPHDFVPWEEPGDWAVAENGAYLEDPADLVDGFSAAVPMPTYYKPTHVRVYGSLRAAVNIYVCDINRATSGIPLGSGTTDAEIEISPTGPNSVNYLSVVVSNLDAADRIYGGYVAVSYIGP